ncbi:PIN domain-containing protein [Pseudovibrio sp. Alg231-02]|uniref:PIN domain-containing protein n=1 Tax=Pseudovibrio sp. Alg231-02 TaxID=1922223 RepID=UPI00131EE936|nr:PIN domain-containing protein [Pseudovibrio sp. Alg231-02]
MLDTNVWISINGFDPRSRTPACYSDYLKSAIDQDNEIIINDYIMAEFFNRCCRIEYMLHENNYRQKKQKIAHLKEFRKQEEFRDFMETMRDTCLHMIEDYTYEAVNGQLNIEALVHELSEGHLDFGDLVIREHCIANDYAVVTHDFDFFGCQLDIVTANNKLLRANN